MKRKNLIVMCALTGAITLGITACGGQTTGEEGNSSSGAAESTISRDDLLTEQIEWVAEQEALVQKVSAQEATSQQNIDDELVPWPGYSRTKPYSAESYDNLKRDGETYYQTGCDDDNGVEGTRPIVELNEGSLWLNDGYESLLKELGAKFSELEEGHFINEGSIGDDNMPGQEIQVQRVDTSSSGATEDDAIDTDVISVSIEGACIPLVLESE